MTMTLEPSLRFMYLESERPQASTNPMAMRIMKAMYVPSSTLPAVECMFWPRGIFYSG